ncbi:MAG TPA: hypothetical protein VEP50_00655 [bacterium]|nr:hypothetical protein [bacterium]
MSDRKSVITIERRDVSPLGVSRRKRFDDSLELLRALGVSPDAIEHYRRQGRKTRRLPHELACAVVEDAARAASAAALVMTGRPA